MKLNYKQFFSIEINYFLKNFSKFIFQKKINFKIDKNNKYVYFLDSPSYGNIGDQAIAYAMRKFMSDNFNDYIQIEFLEENFVHYLSWIKKNIKTNDIICLNGGGNMGVMYQKYEAIRRLIIKSFPNNKIIIFPQTISYDHSKYGVKEFAKSKKIYNAHNNILIMARERKSFDIMKNSYIDKVILSPDIVFYLNYMDCFKKDNLVGLCFRNDKESILSDKEKNDIKSSLLKYDELSTVVNQKAIINNDSRSKIVENTLKEFGSKKMIITDRLHGMIFSYITNTPCIVFNNSNGKVEGVYEWIKNSGNVKFVTEYEKEEFTCGKNVQIDFTKVIGVLKDFLDK